MTLTEASKLVASLGVALNTIKDKDPVDHTGDGTPLYVATMVFEEKAFEQLITAIQVVTGVYLEYEAR